MNPAHYHLLTDAELDRFARDSDDPLVLELLRRMHQHADAPPAAGSDASKDLLIDQLNSQCTDLEEEIDALVQQREQHIQKLEQYLNELKTLTTNN